MTTESDRTYNTNSQNAYYYDETASSGTFSSQRYNNDYSFDRLNQLLEKTTTKSQQKSSSPVSVAYKASSRTRDDRSTTSFHNNEVKNTNNETVEYTTSYYMMEEEKQSRVSTTTTTKYIEEDIPFPYSFSLSEDDWSTQGNQTEQMFPSGGSICTRYTEKTETTVLHQNGATAMMQRQLMLNSAKCESVNNEKVPEPVKITMPGNIDTMNPSVVSSEEENKVKTVGETTIEESLAPVHVERRTTSKPQKRLSNSKLKDNSTTRQKYDDDVSTAIDTVPEDANYYAGSQSIGAFLLSLLSCCQLDVLNE